MSSSSNALGGCDALSGEEMQAKSGDVQATHSHISLPSSSEERGHWSRPRALLAALLEHKAFDPCMGLIICGNVVLMVIDADIQAHCDVPEKCGGAALRICDDVLLGIYTVELLMRLFVERVGFVGSPWNVLDASIVMLGLFDKLLGALVIVPNLNMLRVFRVARLSRIIRLLKKFPTLYILVRGFHGAMTTMFWGFMMMMALLMAWSLIVVELVHPVNKRLETHASEWCKVAFSSVEGSTLWFFQTLVAGDSWGQCTIPVMEKEPWTFFIFAGALVTVQLGFTNLILAVIVDKAVTAREGDKDEVLKEKKKQKMQFSAMLRNILMEADTDDSGTITLHELIQSYDREPRVRKALKMMDIDRKDLKMLFRLMDADQSGSLSYAEFMDSFEKAQLQDMRVYLMVMKLQVEQVASLVRRLPACPCGRWRLGEPCPPTALPPERVFSWESTPVQKGVAAGIAELHAHADLKEKSPQVGMASEGDPSPMCSSMTCHTMRSASSQAGIGDDPAESGADPRRAGRAAGQAAKAPSAAPDIKGLDVELQRLLQSVEAHSDALVANATERALALTREVGLLESWLLEAKPAAARPAAAAMEAAGANQDAHGPPPPPPPPQPLPHGPLAVGAWQDMQLHASVRPQLLVSKGTMAAPVVDGSAGGSAGATGGTTVAAAAGAADAGGNSSPPSSPWPASQPETHPPRGWRF